MANDGVKRRLSESAQRGLKPNVIHFGPNVNDLCKPGVGTCYNSGTFGESGAKFMQHLKEQVGLACSSFKALVVVSTVLDLSFDTNCSTACSRVANEAILQEKNWPCPVHVTDLRGSEFDRLYTSNHQNGCPWGHPLLKEYEVLGNFYGEDLANMYTKCMAKSTAGGHKHTLAQRIV